MTRLTTLADAEAVSERAAAEIVRRLESARRERGIAHLALSGGTTPGRAYELLAREMPSWENIEVWFADERCVGPEDEESNYRMAHETLLEPVSIPEEYVHRMEGELGPEEGAERYAQQLIERVGGESANPGEGLPVLDVVVLGIGPDAHIASLFPGASTLHSGAQAVCLPVHDSPKPPPERITLSLPVLRAARRCLLLATTASKSDAVSAMLGQPSDHVPASLLDRDRLSVLVDDAAAPPGPLPEK
jgi:6-phosphogluconolactonase